MKDEVDNCNFYSSIEPYIRTICNHGQFGLCSEYPRIVDVKSSCSTLCEYPCNDRFKSIITYAKQSIIWEILYNSYAPDEPPDIIFGPDDKKFEVDLEKCMSLASYNPEDPYALYKFLKDVLHQYKTHQIKLISQSHRLNYDYTSLLGAGYKEHDMEVHVQLRKERLGAANFLLKLPICFERIPAYLTSDNPGKDLAILHLTYTSPESSKILTQLYLSPRVEYALGGSSVLRIPVFPNNSCVLDYVSTVQALVENKVRQVINSHERRVEYLSAMLSHFGRSVIEYDAEKYQSITFLFEWNDFFFIIQIDVPLLFPAQKPIIVFQSVYHESKRKPFRHAVNDYPYSPRWSGIEMAERLRTFITENIQAFQKASITGGST